jgi:hypothetical protein
MISESAEDKAYKLQKDLQRKRCKVMSETDITEKQTQEIRDELEESHRCETDNRGDHFSNGNIVNRFMLYVAEGPVYKCTSCLKTEYRKKVRFFNREKLRHAEAVQFVSSKLSIDGRVYVCIRCCNCIKRGVMPAQCQRNRLEVPPIPPELECLNDLEVRLLSTRYPFMKILCLPAGGQAGIQGSVVNVPVNTKQVCENLPRTMDESGLIAVKLKRALKYKGACSYKYIRPAAVVKALDYLRKNNKLYTDVTFNADWQVAANQDDLELWQHLQEPMQEEEATIIVIDIVEIIHYALMMSEQHLHAIPYGQFGFATRK